jgi:hypothetical protein
MVQIACQSKNLRVMARWPRIVMHSHRLTRHSGSTPRTNRPHQATTGFRPVTRWHGDLLVQGGGAKRAYELGKAKRTRHTDVSTQYNLVRFGVANVAHPIKVETQASQIICICTFLSSSPQNEEVFHILYTTFYKLLTLHSSFLWRTRHEGCGLVIRAPLFTR